MYTQVTGHSQYIDINGITDYRRPQPQNLQRLPETDIWYWSVNL
ncbi:enterochelin esterase domain-containing protein [Xenorhabdus ishibashii]